PPRLIANCPVHPSVSDAALTRAVEAEPPSVSVTLVSSALVSAAPAPAMSALTRLRNVGAAAEPDDGPAKTRLTLCRPPLWVKLSSSPTCARLSVPPCTTGPIHSSPLRAIATGRLRMLVLLMGGCVIG